MKNNNDDGTLQELFLESNLLEKSIKHYTQVIPVTIHHFYITGEIEYEVDKYIDMINILKTAESYDKIYLYLNTPGGFLNNTVQIISAIKQSAAEVTTVLEGEVCSAGTFIFLAGDNYIVNENCSFMIHNYSHELHGKGKEVAAQVKFTEYYYEQLAQNLYKDFLTDEEIQAVCDDKDIWMGSEEIIERLKKRGADVVNDLDWEEEYAEMLVEEAANEMPASEDKKKRTLKKKKDDTNE